MGMSISMAKATSKTNLNHNNRELTEREKEKNPHIDESRSDENIYLVQDDIKKLYEREFGQSLENYNEKQTRSDRKIDNYYEHIQASKKTATQQEMIIQVGDKEDFFDEENREVANDVLKEWFNDFEERNPNLKVYNAVIHNDEASPHLHINYVPVASDYKRGLEKQVAFDRAIKQQDPTLDKTRPFDDWRNKEVSVLEKSLKERGIERELVGTNQYKDVNDYKHKKDLEKEMLELDNNISEKKNELLAYSEQVPNKIDVKVKWEMKDVEVPTGEKSLFGKEKTKTEKKRTKSVVISDSDYKKLVSAASDNKKLKGHVNNLMSRDLAKENNVLLEENDQIKGKYNNLVERFNTNVDEFNELSNKNERLKGRISDLKYEISSIYKSSKEFLKERTDGLKAFKEVFKGLVDKVKEKTPKGEFERLDKAEKSRERNRGMDMER